MCWIGMMATTLLLSVLDRTDQGLAILVIPFGTLFSFIPLFMYGAWLGAQMR